MRFKKKSVNQQPMHVAHWMHTLSKLSERKRAKLLMKSNAGRIGEHRLVSHNPTESLDISSV
jgi:hypothetical protein